MEIETIYIPLLNEGTDVWKPVSAERMSDGTFRVCGPIPDEEQWAYQPGGRVVVRDRAFSGGQTALVAERLAIE
jgi:hypothetical protein